jgi:hypothetical protein
MSEQLTIEQRLAALETAVRELQKAVLVPSHTPDPEWWMKIAPIAESDREAFREAMEYGRAYRNADRPPNEPGEEP